MMSPDESHSPRLANAPAALEPMPKPPFELRAQLWRMRAEECRMLAESMHELKAMELMLGCADNYEKLAEWAEAQANTT